MSEETAKPFSEEIILLAEKLGEVTDRLARIEAEHQTQTAPLDAAKGAQDSAIKSLEAALAGIKALNFHVLDNNLGAVSSRLSEVEKQADASLKALDAKLDSTAKALTVLANDTSRHLQVENAQRAELAEKRASDVQTFEQRVSAVRGEIVALQQTLAGQIEAARKEFAEPKGFTPKGKYLPNAVYAKLDVVELNGSSYLSREDTNDEQPGKNAKKWQLIARRGGAGGGQINVVGPGSGDVVGPASATDNALVRFDDATGKLVQNSVVIVNDTGSMRLPSTASEGIRIYNTVSQTTDVEVLEVAWAMDAALIGSLTSGATNRPFVIYSRVGGGGNLYNRMMFGYPATTHGIYTTRSGTTLGTYSLTNIVFLSVCNLISGASSGNATFLSVDPTVNQSATAGYTALRVRVTETSTGSGTKLLMQLGTTESPSVFTVGNAGQVVIAPLPLTQAAPTAIDFSLSNERDITLTGDIEFTTSNLAAGRSVTVYITADGSERTFTFPADWKFQGAKPTTIAAGKTATLALSARSTTDASVRAAYSVEA